MTSLPRFSELLKFLGEPRVILGKEIPKMSSLKPYVDENVSVESHSHFSVIRCKVIKMKLVKCPQTIVLFGKKCERTYFDNYLFDEGLACSEGYRVYMTSICEIVDEKRVRAQ